MSTTSKTPQTRLQGRRMATRTQIDEIPQKFLLLNIIFSLIFLTIISAAFLHFHKFIIRIPRMSLTIDRLIYTLQLQTFTLIPIFICIIYVIFTRVQTGVINPLSGHETYVEKPVRILTNTLEQTFLNIFCQLILVTHIDPEFMSIIPFLIFCFVVGRILFLVGYSIHPKYRTFGFMLSYTPTTVAFLFNLSHITGINRLFHSSSGHRGEF